MRFSAPVPLCAVPAGRAAADARAERLRSRKVRAPRKHGAGKLPAGVSPRESATESKPPPPPQLRCYGVTSRNGLSRRSSHGAKAEARVKGWGKSPPRDRQRERHGKPRREQDRIGATRGATFRPFPAQSSGWVASGVRQRPPQMNGRHVSPPQGSEAIQNPAYRPAGALSFNRLRRPLPDA